MNCYYAVASDRLLADLADPIASFHVLLRWSAVKEYGS